ncbi:MAG: NAD(P)/FAD-dependent oxidoreductase [Acidobacteria bacterium]|nr:NAD(P)/FAD-dependent oxidoreductase [Acidobacteriota bacterium]
MRAAVVGGGPAGSRVAELLCRQGARVFLYEARPGWEKPCGGGVPERGVDFCPFLADPSLPHIRARRARIYSPRGREALVALAEPLRIYCRTQLNGHFLRRAQEQGVEVFPKRVTSLNREAGAWSVTDATGRSQVVDFLVGADGASGIVRGRVAKSLPQLRQSLGIGYYLDGYTSDEIVLKFFDSLDGYLWIFPRPDHLAVGICGPTGAGNSERMLLDLKRFLVELYGVRVLGKMRSYGARIPSPPPCGGAQDYCAGEGWALVGDAAGLVDPLTREGIHYALASATFLAEALCEGQPDGYARRWEAAFGGELEWASAHLKLFFSPRFMEAFTRLSLTAPVAAIVSDLIAGRQKYASLRGRLTACAPAVGLALGALLFQRLVAGRPRATGPALVPLENGWIAPGSASGYRVESPVTAPARGTPSIGR